MQTIMIRIIGMVLGVLLLVPTLIAQQTQSEPANDDQVLALQNQMPEKDSEAYAHLQQMIELDVQNATLEEALTAIADQANLKLMYRKALLPKDRNVSYENRSMSVYDALWYVLDGTGIQFAISQNRQLVLLRMPTVDGSEQEVVQETVTGRVTDAQTGEPLPGVNILIQGTGTGTTTEIDGNFELTVPDLQQTLIITYIGYVRQEVNIEGRTELELSLVPDIIAGDELVVVGYGVQRRSDMTGAVGSVSGEAIQQRSPTNLQESLSGRVSGVQVTLGSGRPGGRATIRIRGNSSISGTNEPLYVVDGTIMNVANLANATSPIDYLDPTNIESIEVLKDASATAIYGARGSNGVVLITTKRGDGLGNRISYNSSVSIGTMTRKIDLLNAEEFLRVEEIAFENAQKFDPGGTYVDPQTKRTDPRFFDSNGNPLHDVDWQEEFSQDAITHNHQLSISGGDADNSYGVDLGFRDEDGVLRGSKLERYSGRLFIDTRVNDWIDAGATINYNVQNESQPDAFGSGGVLPVRSMLQALPITPIRYEDGTWGKTEDYPGMDNMEQPLRMVDVTSRQLDTQNLLANAYLNIGLTDGLELRSTFGTNILNQEVKIFEGGEIPWLSAGTDGRASLTNSEFRSWQFENYLTYRTDIRDSHSLEGLLGLSWQRVNQFSSSLQAEGFPDDFFEFNNLGSAANLTSMNSSASAHSLNSTFSRINYTINNKYLFTLTGRIDGSSRFGADNRYAFFPSAAVGWVVSEENFFPNNSFISSLKVRSSYGQTGNSEIPNYRNVTGLGNYSYIENNERVIGVGIARMANPDLKWETNIQTDIGFEIGFFNNRVLFEGDIYHRKSEDMLLDAPVPSASGYTSVIQNIGSMENKGLELSLTTYNVNTSDFFWSTNFNISMNRNEVLALTGGQDIIQGGNPVVGQRIIREGEPVNSFWGFIHLGTWNTDEAEEAAVYNRLPGDHRYKDVTQSGSITDEDRVIIGNGLPDGHGSLINNFSYKNFELTLDLQFMYGNDVNWYTPATSQDRVGLANSLSTVLNAWTPDNQDTPIAQHRPNAAGTDRFSSTQRIYDGSFIRGRNILLAYNFSPEFMTRVGLNRLRVYASAQNFFLITDYPGYDPEVATSAANFAQGVDLYSYPKSRTVLLGLNVEF